MMKKFEALQQNFLSLFPHNNKEKKKFKRKKKVLCLVGKRKKDEKFIKIIFFSLIKNLNQTQFMFPFTQTGTSS